MDREAAMHLDSLDGGAPTADRGTTDGGALTPSDAEIVGEVKRGGWERYELLVRRYQNRVAGMCRSYLGNAQDAEEAAQDVLVKAYRSIRNFNEDSSFSTWLYRITVNHCIDAIRSRKRRPTVSLDALIEEQGEGAHRLLASGAEFTDLADNRALRDRVLDELPEEYRRVLMLREGEGMTYEEIAGITGWSLDSVKARLRRARIAVLALLRHFTAGTVVKRSKEG